MAPTSASIDDLDVMAAAAAGRQDANAAPVLDVDGHCPICDQATRFIAFNPWLRDYFVCVRCRSIPRERALMIVIEKLYPAWRGLTVHESSPSPRGVSERFLRECPAYTTSQYDVSVPWGETHPTRGYRSENLEAQTFANESFDLVVTQDVFEHIFHPDRAIREIERTLKPGGAHIGTVPIVRKQAASRRRAALRADGSITHFETPEYHGNPIDAGGALVTVDWGYDVTGYLARHSGLEATLFVIDDLTQGVRAEYIEVMVNRKASASSIDGPVGSHAAAGLR